MDRAQQNVVYDAFLDTALEDASPEAVRKIRLLRARRALSERKHDAIARGDQRAAGNIGAWAAQLEEGCNPPAPGPNGFVDEDQLCDLSLNVAENRLK